MARAARLDSFFESMAQGAVPASRTVPDLEAALGLVRQLAGSIASEVRTAPGIGSWAFVAVSDGTELLLWENAASIAS
jgi:predicted enzyme related to lactoylglutathione lyase